MSDPNEKAIHGTDSAEDLIGTSGQDRIHGYAGKDRLYGKAGDDTLHGGEGNDLLDGGLGQDIMYGGAGSDIYRVDNPADMVHEETDSGVDDGAIDYVQSTISYRLGNFVERLELQGAAPINGTGNSLANTLKGNGADNVLSGHGGSDILNGGAGEDTLIGGAGKDYLTGGTGADVFLLDAPNAASVDKIYDFANEDRLGIYAADYNLSEGHGLNGDRLDPSYFTTGSSATVAGHGQFIYNPSSSSLYWDPDGTGSGARISVASLSSEAVVTADHFKIMADRPPVSISPATPYPAPGSSGSVYFLLQLAAPAHDDAIVAYHTTLGAAFSSGDIAVASSKRVSAPKSEASAVDGSLCAAASAGIAVLGMPDPPDLVYSPDMNTLF